MIYSPTSRPATRRGPITVSHWGVGRDREMAERTVSLAGVAAERRDVGARLLVVNDDAGVRETLAAVLRANGHTVQTAGRLWEAAHLLRQAPCDLVLLDLHLNDAEGRDVLQEVRALAPNAAIIVLTGYATLESALHALRAGAHDYLVKPTDVEELRFTVARSLERQRLERELARRVEELEAAHAAVQDFNTRLRAQVEAATQELQRKVEALDATNRQLQQTQQQHERFVAMVAHELRGPIQLVMSYAQLATRPDVSREAIGKYAASIVEYAQNLTRLVDDLQTATRLSTGHFDLRQEQCDLVVATRELVDQFRTTVPDRRFSFAGEPDLEPVEVDRARVLQAVRNLLDNAVKYSVDDGAIDVSVSGDEGHVYLSVHDEGAGIPEQDVERILRPFERGAGSTDVPGSGLGLYITRGIVEAHGGELRVQNGSGPERAKGAVFTLALPRAAAQPATDPHA
jgi:signal transduction histidine kinase